MASLAARNCLLAVLLTAAVACGERTLADTLTAAPLDKVALPRCEPANDFSTPASALPASRDHRTFDGIGSDGAAARPETSMGRLPARTWLFIRSSARTSVYLGVNRRGVAGLHFFQHAPTATSIAQVAPHRSGD